MKKLFLTMLVALTATTFSFAEITRIYFSISNSYWFADGATVAIYAEGENDIKNAEKPGVRMTRLGTADPIWYTDIDLSLYTKITFCRVNNDAEAVYDWGARTNELLVSTIGDNDLYTITSFAWYGGDEPHGYCEGIWSKLSDKTLKRIYCKIPQTKWWDADDNGIDDGAGIALYAYNAAGPNANFPGTIMTVLDEENHIWYADIYFEDYTNLIFARTDAATGLQNWGAETISQSISDNNIGTTNDMFTMTEFKWHGSEEPFSYCTGDWSKYSTPTAISNTVEETKTVKHIVNGQLFILRDGKTFNTLGAELK